jgi:hypothetical protein
MAKAKESKPAAKGGKGDKAGKGDTKSKKGGGGKGGSKADADSGETRLSKLKGAMTINVRHILVSIHPSVFQLEKEKGPLEKGICLAGARCRGRELHACVHS